MKKISLYVLIALIIASSAVVWKNAHKVTPGNPFDTIIVGTNGEFQPFSFKDGDTITGFDIDIITEVIKRLNKKIIIKDMPFDALIPEIQLGNIHVIAAGITPTKERSMRTLFTQPHLTSDFLVIISLKNNPITSIHDLKDKIVVVNEGYTAESYMADQKGISVTSIASNTPSDGILALQSGRADAFVTALYPLKSYFDSVGTDNFIITPIPGTQESSAFGISKHYPELRDYIQIMLDRMEQDGTITEIKKKWNLL